MTQILIIVLVVAIVFSLINTDKIKKSKINRWHEYCDVSGEDEKLLEALVNRWDCLQKQIEFSFGKVEAVRAIFPEGIIIRIMHERGINIFVVGITSNTEESFSIVVDDESEYYARLLKHMSTEEGLWAEINRDRRKRTITMTIDAIMSPQGDINS